GINVGSGNGCHGRSLCNVFRSAFYLCAGAVCRASNFAIVEKTGAVPFARLAHGQKESASEPVPSFSDWPRPTLYAPAFGRGDDLVRHFPRGGIVFVPFCAVVSGLHRRDAIRIPAPTAAPQSAADVRGRL